MKIIFWVELFPKINVHARDQSDTLSAIRPFWKTERLVLYSLNRLEPNINRV